MKRVLFLINALIITCTFQWAIPVSAAGPGGGANGGGAYHISTDYNNLPTGLIVMLVLGIPLLIAIIILARKGLRLEKSLHEDGIVADAVVVRCESRLSDGRTRYTPYVRYVAGGEEHEAALNLRSNLPIGRKLKIKYIPGKWDYVAFVSQEL